MRLSIIAFVVEKRFTMRSRVNSGNHVSLSHQLELQIEADPFPFGISTLHRSAITPYCLLLRADLQIVLSFRRAT